MKDLFLVAIVVLFFVVIFQIAKASEYVSILKGEEKTRKQNNKINGFLMLVFLVLGLFGAWYCNELYYGETLFPQGSASVEGEEVDNMLMITIAITGVVLIITQILLFWFSYKYQEKDDRKAHYYPHNNKLEIIWTTIPAITLTILIVFGLKFWLKITGEPPKDALMVEITGHQFGWDIRYAGKDGIFGKKNYKLYNQPAGNSLGVDFNDPESHDDIRVSEMHLPVNRPVKLIIHSQDVIHDVGLPHFRLKMDAVPGIPTTLWFTPKITTKEMREKTGNPNFTYEIACDQMCGKGHFSMRGVIVVETEEEFNAWMEKQKPEYFTIFPDKDPANKAPVAEQAVSDSTNVLAVNVGN